jgi:hypothetical protein
VIERLKGWGADSVENDGGEPEDVVFALPKALSAAIREKAAS